MAGIYIHIPFCKQPCSYCNFYFSTSLVFKEKLIAALISELSLQSQFTNNQTIETIYFGGGTPSVLDAGELHSIINTIHKYYPVSDHAEITLEANPDDIEKNKLSDYKTMGINRLSIGVQSFYNEDLALMNRAHNSQQAESCIKISQDAGIENISIDLIYGIPGLDERKWKENLSKSDLYKVKHLSCYALTVEENTILFHQIRKKKINEPSNSTAATHFRILMDYASENNWLHYEISNFCKEGYHSRHNSSYWEGKHYLGIGPSAHSFDGNSRQWNIANNKKYIESIESGKIPAESEILSEQQKWNEYIMIGLRTSNGIDLNYLEHKFPQFIKNFYKNLKTANQSYFTKTEKGIKLSEEGIYFADKLAADFFE
jgi:oxygen-independent coproporphyrinogen III oxidase